jgi:hypothetical protein
MTWIRNARLPATAKDYLEGQNVFTNDCAGYKAVFPQARIRVGGGVRGGGGGVGTLRELFSFATVPKMFMRRFVM